MLHKLIEIQQTIKEFKISSNYLWKRISKTNISGRIA